jgi:Ser/Thr protein kinase RdoA (MazF antagonist)
VFAMRLHRKGYRTDAELISELQYMAALSEQGIGVPQPLASQSGHYVQHQDQTQVSMLTWLSGRTLGKSGAPLDLPDQLDTFERFGRLVASMHTATDAWRQPVGFTRQPWGLEGLLGDYPQWGCFWDNPFLTAGEKEILRHVRDKLRNELEASTFDMGLVHADLVSENILLDGNDLRIIDFDDCGFGYRLQDIATALVKHEAEPDFEDLKQALISGYRSMRELDADHVDTFLLLRHLSYVGWVVPRMSDAAGPRRCAWFIKNAINKARDYLKT